MTLEHGVRTVAIILAAAAACAMVPRAAAQPTTYPDTTAIARADLEQLAATLNGPPSDAPTDAHDRDEAAQRLVSRQSAEARAILLGAMTSNNPAAQLSVAKAVTGDAQPDPALINPLFDALRTPRTAISARLPDAAARALVVYNNPDVLRRLIAIVVDRTPREPEPLRRDILHGLSFSSDKQAAEALVRVVRTADEPEGIRKAAAAALSDMSGITDYGADSQRWTEWLNNQKSPADFRNEIIARRAAADDELRRQNTELSGELRDLLNRQFIATPPAQQTDFLLTYLRSQYAGTRAETAQIIEDNVASGTRPPETVRAQLRFMIGDSDSKVRISAIRALTSLNDNDALNKVLAQVTQEKDGLVRAELAKAMGTINKLEAVPTLVEMIKADPSVPAVTAAARALGDLGTRMVTEKSTLVTPAAQALRDAFEKQPTAGGNSELRETLLLAMIPLRQSDLIPTYYRLLQPGAESTNIRRYAIKALGEIGDPRSFSIIADAMQDKITPQIRVEAVTAMGKLPNANQGVNGLIQRANKAEESEQSVRDAAAIVLRDIMPTLTPGDIQTIILLYKDEPERQFIFQKTLEDVFKMKKSPDLPLLQQNMGVNQLKQQRYSEAAEYFKKALDYKIADGAPGSVISQLRSDRLDALLKARQFDEATAFAAEGIKADNGFQTFAGPSINQFVSQLIAQKSFNDAIKLIEAVMKMDPQLSPYYTDLLRDKVEQIKKDAAAPNAIPATRPNPQ